MPLSNIWVPRRDGRGLFVPKRPHTALPDGSLTSVNQQWANWIYPVPTRGVYWSGVDQIGVNGLYGGTADRTPTHYGLGINTPDSWEWGGPNVGAGAFSTARQTHFSVFYLYDATKLITSGRYPSLGPNRSRNTAPSSIDEPGLIWSNQSGEQSVIATTFNVTFGGVNASVTGVGNGLHCAVASYTVNGNLELYLDGVSVATGTTGTYIGGSTVRPNFFWGGLGPANQNVGVILLAGIIYTQAFTAAEVQAFTANPFGYFFVDAPNRRRQLYSVTIQSGNYPASDITTTGWSAVPPGSLFSAVDEASASDTDYIVSPDLAASPGPVVMGLDQSVPAGSYTVNVRARYSLTGGQFRVSLLDSGGTSVGTSAWIALTGSFAAYPISLTTTGTAARVKIEVQ
jgi:hypothetical protein